MKIFTEFGLETLYCGVFGAVLFSEGEIENFRTLGGPREQKISQKNNFLEDFDRNSTWNLVLEGFWSRSIQSGQNRKFSNIRWRWRAKTFAKCFFSWKNAIFSIYFALFGRNPYEFIRTFLYIICFEQLSRFLSWSLWLRDKLDRPLSE